MKKNGKRSSKEGPGQQQSQPSGGSESVLPDCPSRDCLGLLFQELKLIKSSQQPGDLDVLLFGEGGAGNELLTTFLIAKGCPAGSRVTSAFAAGKERSEMGAALSVFAEALRRLLESGVEGGAGVPEEWSAYLRANHEKLQPHMFELQGFATLLTYVWAQIASAEHRYWWALQHQWTSVLGTESLETPADDGGGNFFEDAARRRSRGSSGAGKGGSAAGGTTSGSGGNTNNNNNNNKGKSNPPPPRSNLAMGGGGVAPARMEHPPPDSAQPHSTNANDHYPTGGQRSDGLGGGSPSPADDSLSLNRSPSTVMLSDAENSNNNNPTMNNSSTGGPGGSHHTQDFSDDHTTPSGTFHKLKSHQSLLSEVAVEDGATPLLAPGALGGAGAAVHGGGSSSSNGGGSSGRHQNHPTLTGFRRISLSLDSTAFQRRVGGGGHQKRDNPSPSQDTPHLPSSPSRFTKASNYNNSTQMKNVNATNNNNNNNNMNKRGNPNELKDGGAAAGKKALLKGINPFSESVHSATAHSGSRSSSPILLVGDDGGGGATSAGNHLASRREAGTPNAGSIYMNSATTDPLLLSSWSPPLAPTSSFPHLTQNNDGTTGGASGSSGKNSQQSQSPSPQRNAAGGALGPSSPPPFHIIPNWIDPSLLEESNSRGPLGQHPTILNSPTSPGRRKAYPWKENGPGVVASSTSTAGTTGGVQGDLIGGSSESRSEIKQSKCSSENTVLTILSPLYRKPQREVRGVNSSVMSESLNPGGAIRGMPSSNANASFLAITGSCSFHGFTSLNRPQRLSSVWGMSSLNDYNANNANTTVNTVHNNNNNPNANRFSSNPYNPQNRNPGNRPPAPPGQNDSRVLDFSSKKDEHGNNNNANSEGTKNNNNNNNNNNKGASTSTTGKRQRKKARKEGATGAPVVISPRTMEKKAGAGPPPAQQGGGGGGAGRVVTASTAAAAPGRGGASPSGGLRSPTTTTTPPSPSPVHSRDGGGGSPRLNVALHAHHESPVMHGKKTTSPRPQQRLSAQAHAGKAPNFLTPSGPLYGVKLDPSALEEKTGGGGGGGVGVGGGNTNNHTDGAPNNTGFGEIPVIPHVLHHQNLLTGGLLEAGSRTLDPEALASLQVITVRKPPGAEGPSGTKEKTTRTGSLKGPIQLAPSTTTKLAAPPRPFSPPPPPSPSVVSEIARVEREEELKKRLGVRHITNFSEQRDLTDYRRELDREMEALFND